jgi:hypothetical protein
LPFLGAGQTHVEGQYKEAVHNGLYFLMGRAKREDENVLSLFELEGTMYRTAGTIVALRSLRQCEG